MKRILNTAIIIPILLVICFFCVANAKPIKPVSKDNPLSELVSGYYFSSSEVRGLQNDDFGNPGMLWQEKGQALWKKQEGRAGKSCRSCHNDARLSMDGVATRYPVYYDPWRKPISVQQRINLCRTNRMKAPKWRWESLELVAMTVYVNFQSRGKFQNVEINDQVKPFFERGNQFYYQRRGQFNMSCAHCHENHYGNKLGGILLSQGQATGFPAYRLRWQKVGSLHRRFKACNRLVRAKPYKAGSDAYVNLELYVRWRGQGLPIETPAVRQ